MALPADAVAARLGRPIPNRHPGIPLELDESLEPGSFREVRRHNAVPGFTELLRYEAAEDVYEATVLVDAVQARANRPTVARCLLAGSIVLDPHIPPDDSVFEPRASGGFVLRLGLDAFEAAVRRVEGVIAPQGGTAGAAIRAAGGVATRPDLTMLAQQIATTTPVKKTCDDGK